MFNEIDEQNKQEDAQYGDYAHEAEGYQSNLSSDQIRKKADELNEQLARPADKKEKQRVKRVESKLRQAAQKMEQYEDQQKMLAGRNSYSKTDTDAIFMRMKDGQFLPAYNVIQGTEDQFIVNYTLAQSSGESHLLKAHLQQLEQRLGRLPQNIVGDAAYGSEENYTYLKDKSCKRVFKVLRLLS